MRRAWCPCKAPLPDALMQSIALENNLPETAFFFPEGKGYRLRWFSPTTEIALCGHATVATAYVITEFLDGGQREMSFETRSGRLGVERQGRHLRAGFSRSPDQAGQCPAGRCSTRPASPAQLLKSYSWLAVYDSWDDVAALTPDFDAMAKLDLFGVIATAPGRDGPGRDAIDYVSPLFRAQGRHREDPATGSAQCVLVPYWARRLGRNKLVSRQISSRVGDFDCELVGERVRSAGAPCAISREASRCGGSLDLKASGEPWSCRSIASTPSRTGCSAAIPPASSRWRAGCPTATLQAIAFENNQAETAFFVPDGEGYRLRWFTPTSRGRYLRSCDIG